MTNAYAIKGPDGNIDLVLIDTDIEETWYEYIKSVEGRVPTSGSIVKDIQYWKDEGFTCVPVAVSEKGEADDVPVKDVGDYYAIQFGNGIYLQRKAIKTATEQPLSDTDNVIIKLCAYLSRGQG